MSFGKYADMNDHPDILSEVQQYCESAGIAPSTLALRAVNNARFFDRFARRVEQDRTTVEKLRSYMRQHPPETREGAA